MSRLAIVDAGPLYAAADRGERDHAACLEVLSRPDLRLIVATFAAAEAAYLVGQRMSAAHESAFIRGLSVLEIEGPSKEDLLRMADLVVEYADVPLGSGDASVVALAERYNTDIVITLDRRHFATVRPRHRDAFTLLP